MTFPIEELGQPLHARRTMHVAVRKSNQIRTRNFIVNSDRMTGVTIPHETVLTMATCLNKLVLHRLPRLLHPFITLMVYIA